MGVRLLARPDGPSKDGMMVVMHRNGPDFRFNTF